MGGQYAFPHLQAICFVCSQLGISSSLHTSYKINLSVLSVSHHISQSLSSSSTNHTPFRYLLLLGYGSWRSSSEVGVAAEYSLEHLSAEKALALDIQPQYRSAPLCPSAQGPGQSTRRAAGAFPRGSASQAEEEDPWRRVSAARWGERLRGTGDHSARQQSVPKEAMPQAVARASRRSMRQGLGRLLMSSARAVVVWRCR